MRRAVDVGWLNRAICLCRSSAVAYKSAYLLASDPCDERRLLELCTARYAVLERLLTELATSTGPAHLRRLLQSNGDDVQPASLDAALAAAFLCDCGLMQMLDPDPAWLADASTALAAGGTHTPSQQQVADACSRRGAVRRRRNAASRHRATSP